MGLQLSSQNGVTRHCCPLGHNGGRGTVTKKDVILHCVCGFFFEHLAAAKIDFVLVDH